MRKIYFLLLTILIAAIANAQLTGTKNIPGDYATIAAAVTDLNSQGVGAGGVTFNVAAGFTETAPAGGINVTATGTAANPIVFQKSGVGSNPLLTSPVGTNTLSASSTTVDGIFSFSGSDYVTIDGIDLLDNNASGAAMMEYGYGFFKASAADGDQNNTVKNCVITLNKTDSVAGPATFGPGCKGIFMGDVTINAVGTELVIATAGGRNNNNTFSSNTIQNCYYGIYLRGYGDGISPYANLDQNNTIGGNSAPLGNIIRNYGGGGYQTVWGMQTVNQNNLLVQYNNVNNTASGGTTPNALIGGISITGSFTVNNSTYNILNNTVTLAQGNNTFQIQGINVGTAGGTGTVTISNNTITGFTNLGGVTGGAMFGTVVSNTAGATVNINNNTYSNNQVASIVNMISLQASATAATANINGNSFTTNTISTNATGTTILIANGAAVTGTLSISNNIINGLDFPTAMSNTAALIFSSAAGASLAYTATGNSFTNVTYPGGFTSTLYLMYCATGAPASANFSSNTFNNLSLNSITTGSIYGIYNTSNMGTYTASNNTFSNISTSSTGTTALVYNLGVISGTATVNGNSFTNINRSGTSGTHYTIYTGSPANGTYNANTIDGISFTAATSTGSIYGIYDISSGVNMTYTNNIVRNLSTATTGSIFGIRDVGITGNKTIQNNQVYNFSTSAGGAGGASMTGISWSAGGTDDISNNLVYSLNSTGTTGGTGGTIIGIQSSAGTTNNIYKNKVYDLSTTSTGGSVNGISVTGGTTNNVYNNLVGDLRTPAVSATNALIGLNVTGGTTSNFYYNTVYLNGTSAGANFGSSAISVSTTPTVVLNNNIFVNNSTPNGTGLTVAHRRSSTTLTSYGATSNNNLFYAGAPGASRLIYNDGTNSDQTLAAYKTRVSPRDATSVTENPPFLSTTGSSANFLHISTAIATQVESGGATIAGITDDYDGNTRNATTPDIGADEFNGILLDITSPTISYTPLAGNCSIGSRTLTATITDASGVPTSGIGLPVLYWKINSGAYTGATATYLGSNQYQFTLGTGSVVGDIISYYIVAQDNATPTNIGASPSGGAGGFTSNPPAASTPPTIPNSYVNLATLSGTFTVGTGGNYATLTAAIADYNTKCLSGPVVFNLISANYPAETFPITINSNPGASSTNTLTIKPAAGVAASFTGLAASTALIKFSGATYVTIDGLNTGGSSLTFNNVNTGASAVIWLASTALAGSNNIALNNLMLNGGSPTGTTNFGIIAGIDGATPSTTAGLDNDNITINGNTIQKCYYGIYANGTAAVSAGGLDNWTISGNTIGPVTAGANNIGFAGIWMANALNLTISNNNIQNIVTTSSPTGGVYLSSNVNGFTISGNNIHDINSTAASTGTSSITAIYLGSNVINSPTSIKNNTIKTIVSSTTGGYGVRAITVNTGNAASNISIYNNMISDIYNYQDATVTLYGTLGITVDGATGGIRIYYNTVNLFGSHPGYAFNTTGGVAACMYVNSSVAGGLDIRDNIFSNSYDNATSTGDKAYAIYSLSANTVFGNINYNDYYVSGTGGPVLGFLGSDQTTLAALQAAFGGNANSINVQPNYISTTNLHLNPAINNSLNNLGTTIAGITTDIDGDTRNVTTPDMGADEFTPCVAPTATATSNSPVCQGSTISLTGTSNGTSFSWTGPNGFTSTLQNPTIPNASIAAGGVYSFQAFSGGCASLVSNTTVVVNSTPQNVTATASSSNVCNGSSINLFSSSDPLYGGTPTNIFSEDWASGSFATNGWTFTPSQGNWTVGASYTPTGGTAPNAFFNWTPSVTNYTYSLVSAVINASSYTNITLDYLLQLDNFSTATIEQFSVEYKKTTDATWTLLENFTNQGGAGVFNYVRTNQALTGMAGNSFQIRYTAYGANSFNINGWGLDNIIIKGQSVLPLSYSWTSTPAGFTSTQQNPTGVIVSATTTYTVTITSTTSGCSASANTTVNMNSPIISGSTIIQPSTCTSNDGSITITVTGGTGGVGPYTYSWTGSGTGLIPTAQNQSGLSVGTYTVVITDVPSGCTTTQAFALPGPGGCICPTISNLTTVPTPNGCINTNVTLNATGLANMGTAYGITFKYSTTPLADPYVGGTVIANVPNTSLTAGGTAASTTTTFAAANTYYLYAILFPVAPDPTCRPFKTVTLPVYGNPSIVNQPQSSTICSGQNTSFSVTTTGTPVTYQWQINQGAGFVDLANVAPFSGVNTATLTITGATTVYNGNTFRVILGPCGGATSNVVTLTVNPLPIITVGPSGQCAPVTLVAAGNSNTYSWAPATGLSATTGSTVIATPAVNTTYTVTGTITATGCQNSATVSVLGNSTAAVLSASPTTICNTQTVNLVVTITGGVGPFTVVYNNGTTNVTVNNYNSGANIPVTPSASTSYRLVSVTGANGCAGGGINVTPIAITVNPLPTIAVGPNNQCSPVTLTATGTSNTYSWSPTTGLTVTNPPPGGSGSIASVSTTTTTTYTVTGTITATGCQASANVTVLGTPLTPVLSPTAANVCLGGIVQLNATATPAATWSPATGLYTDNTATTPYVAGTLTNTVYAKPTITTTYSVISTSGTCPSPAATITVTVTQPVSITTQPTNQTVCAGATATFSVVAAGNLLNYQWFQSTDAGVTFNPLTTSTTYNGVNASTLSIIGTTTTMNNYRYRVVVSNSCGTVTSNAVTLTVNALPVVTATALSNRICLSDSLISLVGTPAGGVWSGIGVYGNTFIPMRTAVGTYTLTYTFTNASNCIASTTVIAKVEDCPERIRELDNKGVLLYPNPNDGHFNLKVNSTLYNYLGMRVYTMAGSIVKIQSWTNLQYGRIIPVDLSNLPSAVYQVRIYYDAGSRTAQKVFNVIVAH